MKQVEFWYWLMRNPVTGEIAQSSCRLTEAEALKRDPDAYPIEGTCQVRVLPKHPDEWLPKMALAAPSSYT
ncbi:hypothetical protein LNV08_15520 [Paucibacter sp. TC2R-5]|uniref:hypothetical protein n=1 Tax=Paucibacter sp. TC2R-5 TaxID=2893555 RepID=UPI0021E4644C|nr:hypothetical protein [Paucibacter sp. TC2R-5]MCV2360385.1 hypothetical protein [Paucibacter sp. TC2R-5]